MDILYQDESIIAVNKPSGLLTIQDGYDPDLPTVKKEIEKELGRCWIVHRLDKETSGVLLLARNAPTHRLLNIAFQNHQIRKTYHAILIGIPVEAQFVINQPLKGDRNHRTIIDEIAGKPASTIVSVLKTYSHFTLASIEPQTGYTHQIRAHLSYCGFPLFGDKLYKSRNPTKDLDSIKMDHVALHAYQIHFCHPTTNLELTIHADYPEDFRQALASFT
jgi:tRNA pseudouridine32 synthase/23S rRNA pseudouridine746 synthase